MKLRALDESLKRRIGRRLCPLRESRGLSQEDVAAAIDRSVETVSNIERGRVLAALETLDRLSRSLDVPIAAFFDDVALRLLEAVTTLREERPGGGRR